MDANNTIKIETYHWGTLRTLRCGISYTCILHPEHTEAVAALGDGERCRFTDEQGIRWTASRCIDTITFKADYRHFTMLRDELGI